MLFRSAEGNITYPNFSDYVKGKIEPSGVPSPSDLKIYDAAFSPIGGGGASAVSAAGTSSGTSASQQNTKSGGSSSSGAQPFAGVAAGALALVAGAGVVLGGL